MKKINFTAVAFCLACSNSMSGELIIPNEFQAGTPAVAAEVNANFTSVASEVNDNNQRINSKQDRVSGTCSEGSAIRSIEENGSVICQSSGVSSLHYRVFLQDGLEGYSGTRDTSIYKVPDVSNPAPGSNGQIYAEYQADSSTGRLALIQFDLSSILSNAESYFSQFKPGFTIENCESQITVYDAKLQLLAIPGSGSSGTTPAFLLRYFDATAPLFDEASANWTNANATEIWNKSGTTVETFEDLIGGLFEAKDMPTSSFGRTYSFNVEPDTVKQWICDATSNKGMAIQIFGGGTGGSMKFFSREISVERRRPKLIIDLGLN